MQVNINGKDITKIVSSLSLNSSIESLSTTLSITIPNLKKLDKKIDIKVGDKVDIHHNENIFQGMIVEVSETKDNYSIKAFDVAFYLGKNKILKQIRNTKGKEAIKNICSELGIPIDINGLDTVINKVYRNSTVSEVIEDIIKQDFERNGKEYVIYAKDNKVIVEPLGTIKFNPTFKINDISLEKEHIKSDYTITKNIENLVNSVKAYSDNEKSVKLLGQAEDSSSIDKYGKIQEVVEIQALDVKKVKSIANNILKSKNKITSTISVNINSDIYLFAGGKFEEYIIISCDCNFQNNYFTCNLSLRGDSNE